MYSEFLQKLNTIEDNYVLEEVFETHSELNPELFDGLSLKEDIRQQLLKIADTFVESIQEDNVPIHVLDYWLVGSNAQYNYSASSDIDIHVIVDTDAVAGTPYLLNLLYDYIKSNFNNKYDVMVKGHEVELYIEDVKSGAITDGIYSLKQDKWIKEPSKVEPKSIDITQTQLWLDTYSKYQQLTDEECEEFLDNLHIMRKISLAQDGEWGDGNLVFKEFRNRGYIQDLKDRKYLYKSKELTLESLNESILTEVTSKELNTLLTRVKKELEGKGYTYQVHQSYGCIDIFFNRTLIGQAYPRFEKMPKEFYTLVEIDDCSDVLDGDILYVKRLKNGLKPKIVGIEYIKNVNNIAPDGTHFNANVTSVS